MALREIRKTGDEVLRKISKRVDVITPRIVELLDDMKDTMIEANGVGLAAPQVGVLKRIFVVDTGEKIVELINPSIVATKGEQEESEGCLSVPGKFGIVKRPAEVTMEATDRHGNYFTLTGTELLARALCHELDHLDGKLFTDCVIRYVENEK